MRINFRNVESSQLGLQNVTVGNFFNNCIFSDLMTLDADLEMYNLSFPSSSTSSFVYNGRTITYNGKELMYKIKSGDNLSTIAKDFGVSVETLKKLNGLNSDNISAGNYLKIPGSAYIVKSGDNLTKIAKNFGLTIDELKKLNNLKSDSIREGQILIVIKADKDGNKANESKSSSNETSVDNNANQSKGNSSARVYTVVSGDTLSEIAVKNGCTVQQILDVNKGLKADSIRKGQEIILPTTEGLATKNSEAQNVEKSLKTSSSLKLAQVRGQDIQCVHTVENGDNFEKVARQYGIFTRQLINANPKLAGKKYLQPGDEILVPYPIPLKKIGDLSKKGNDFLARLRVLESRGHGEYKAENFAGYLGAYQMGKAALHDIGVYYEKSEAYVNNKKNKEWKGIFIADNKFGITSVDDFLNSPEKQDMAIIRYMQLTWLHIENEGWNKYIGKTMAGVKITELGLIAACHLVGRDNVKTFLTSNGKVIPTDGNNPPQPLTKYLGDSGLMGENKDFILF